MSDESYQPEISTSCRLVDVATEEARLERTISQQKELKKLHLSAPSLPVLYFNYFTRHAPSTLNTLHITIKRTFFYEWIDRHSEETIITLAKRMCFLKSLRIYFSNEYAGDFPNIDLEKINQLYRIVDGVIGNCTLYWDVYVSKDKDFCSDIDICIHNNNRIELEYGMHYDNSFSKENLDMKQLFSILDHAMELVSSLKVKSPVKENRVFCQLYIQTAVANCSRLHHLNLWFNKIILGGAEGKRFMNKMFTKLDTTKVWSDFAGFAKFHICQLANLPNIKYLYEKHDLKHVETMFSYHSESSDEGNTLDQEYRVQYDHLFSE